MKQSPATVVSVVRSLALVLCRGVVKQCVSAVLNVGHLAQYCIMPQALVHHDYTIPNRTTVLHLHVLHCTAPLQVH
jgi:hypothetical protein